MKTAIIITSIIDVDNAFPLTYSEIRSFFSSQERLDQTINTVNCVDGMLRPNRIYLLDASCHFDYADSFAFQDNLSFFNVNKYFPEIHQEVVTHPHKSRCECLILAAFMEKFSTELSQYDIIYKISGRYLINTGISLPAETGKIWFKSPQQFEWNDSWGLGYLDLRHLQKDNTLRQYSTVLFAWDTEHNNTMLDIFKKIANTVIESGKSNSDMETLIYFFTRTMESFIIETNWCIYGWNGTNGNFIRY